jgi:hypothetical protein
LDTTRSSEQRAFGARRSVVRERVGLNISFPDAFQEVVETDGGTFGLRRASRPLKWETPCLLWELQAKFWFRVHGMSGRLGPIAEGQFPGDWKRAAIRRAK